MMDHPNIAKVLDAGMTHRWERPRLAGESIEKWPIRTKLQ